MWGDLRYICIPPGMPVLMAAVYMVERKGRRGHSKNGWERLWLVLASQTHGNDKDICKFQALGLCHRFFKCMKDN